MLMGSSFRLAVVLLFGVAFCVACVQCRQDENQQNAYMDDTKDCLGNDGDQASLNSIKPQIFYFRIGGSESSESTKNKYKHVFNMGYRDEEFRQANIDPELSTKMIAHGFQGSFNGTDNGWIQWMLDTLNKSPKTTYNVFVLSWPNGYVSMRDGLIPGYGVVAGTTRTIGSYVGLFLVRMRETIGLRLDQTHLIGHSLGAHVMGFAGKYLKENVKSSDGVELARISGLDPAGPCFHLSEAKNRLDVEDAHYVDAIHTNNGALGISTQNANRDISINGGSVQPGCSVANVSCSHQRVTHLFSYQVTEDCQMVAYQCKDYEQFKEGACKSCQKDKNRCTLVNFPINLGQDEYEAKIQRKVSFKPEESELNLGVYPAESTDDRNQKNEDSKKKKELYYISTGDENKKPLCQQHYQVRLLTNVKVEGKLFADPTLTLVTDEGYQYKVTMKKQNDNLWTGLLTFDGPMIKFSQAIVKLGNSSNDAKLALAVDFMSHVCVEKRKLYSSVLCPLESVNSNDDSNNNNRDKLQVSKSDALTLETCSQYTSDQVASKFDEINSNVRSSNRLFKWFN